MDTGSDRRALETIRQTIPGAIPCRNANRTLRLTTSRSRLRRSEAMAGEHAERANRSTKGRAQPARGMKGTLLLSLLATTPIGAVADCISLANSTQCPAFSAASISTNQTLIDLLYVSFPRLKAPIKVPCLHQIVRS